MNTLLIRPPATFPKGSSKPAVSLPLGLLYIAAMLEKSGHETQMFDAQVCRAMPVSQDPGGTAAHLGFAWGDIEAEIRKRKPDVVGITSQFTAQMFNAIRAAEIVKRIDPGILTVVGGNHATVRPEDFFLKTSAVDLVCMGEGEHTMVEIADAVRAGRGFHGIPGTAMRDGIGIRRNPPRPLIANLDELPFPAYHLANLEEYFLLRRNGLTDRPFGLFGGSDRAVSVITSRGCPFNCVFCSIHLHMGRKWRAQSVEHVLSHLDYLVSRYGVNHVHFEDDNISANPKRFKDLLDGLRGTGNRFTWDTPNGVRVDTLSREILEQCKETGCVYVIFGVESGNQDVLDGIVNKKLDLGAVTQAAAWCREIGLDAMSFFVIGFPGETPRQMMETVDFALRLQSRYDVNPGLFVATPLPGTRLEAICRERGLLDGDLSPEFLARLTQGAVVMGGGTFEPADVVAMRNRFLAGYKRNAVRNALRFLAASPGSFPALLHGYREARRRAPRQEALHEIYLFKNFIAGKGAPG